MKDTLLKDDPLYALAQALVDNARRCRETPNGRTKATVVQVGFIDPITKSIKDWVFDCHNVVPAVKVGQSGVTLYAGYSFEELMAFQVEAARNGSQYPSKWKSIA